jgi:MFS transporter, ACS family, tartrate transporter
LTDAAIQTEAIDQARLAPILKKVALRLIPFMFVLYIMSYLDRINVSFAGLQMNKDLGFSEEIFGLGAGVFFIGYFLFGVPSNLMVERLGARRWISVIMVIWGAISVAMALVKSDFDFYILRFFLGVAEAGFFPGMILYLTYWFPKREHGLAVARFMTAIPAAGVLGGLISAQVLGMTGVMGLPGWKWLFIITGAPSVVLGFIVFYYLTDKPEHAHWLAAEEREYLLKALKLDKQMHAAGTTSFWDAFKNGRVWLLAVLYFSITLGMYGFQLWLPQIIKSTGQSSDTTTALLSAIPAVFQALGMILIAGHSDKTGERRFHVALAAAVAALGLVCTGFVKDPYVALATLSLTAFGLWGCVGPFWCLSTSYLSREAAASGIGLINSVGNLGGFVGPFLVGFIKNQTHEFMPALFAMAGSLIIAGILATQVKSSLPETDS